MPKVSKLVCWVAICFMACAVSGIPPLAASGDQRPGAPSADLPPSPLEAFATRSNAKVVWSKMIGRFESQETRATLTALTVEDTTSQPNVMRGLRIELAHIGAPPSCDWKYSAWSIMCKRANAAIYIEDGKLETVRDSIERHGTAELRPREFISQYWSSNAGGGLIVCGYQFSNRQPGDLAELLTRAITELKAAPR